MKLNSLLLKLFAKEKKKRPNVSVIGSLHKKSESHFELVDGKTSVMLQMSEEFAVNNTL
jgi:hypothetical protein